MAMIDYGAMLKVDGKFINKNQFFMETSDTGYMIKSARYAKYDMEVDIEGDYVAYAGDEDLLVCFFKRSILVVSHGEVVYSSLYHPFISETVFVNGTQIKISHLDPQLYNWHDTYETSETWPACVGLTDEEEYDPKHPWVIRNIKTGQLFTAKRQYKSWEKYNSHVRHSREKYRTGRYLVEWEHTGKHYECIFGYGIDTNEDVWEEIKYKYEFTDTERKIIDEWFKEA